jgi:hypothetical protein
MSIRPIREVPAAREVAELISDFDRPSFGTLRGRQRPIFGPSDPRKLRERGRAPSRDRSRETRP